MNKNIFSEIRKVRKSQNSTSTNIDGKSGSAQISEHFKTIYETLFNEQSNAQEEQKLDNLYDSINDGIAQDQDTESIINLMTINVVKQAISRLKAGKGDISGLFTSDCLKEAPDILSEKLAMIFRNFLRHGYASESLLNCA